MTFGHLIVYVLCLPEKTARCMSLYRINQYMWYVSQYHHIKKEAHLTDDQSNVGVVLRFVLKFDIARIHCKVLVHRWPSNTNTQQLWNDGW